VALAHRTFGAPVRRQGKQDADNASQRSHRGSERNDFHPEHYTGHILSAPARLVCRTDRPGDRIIDSRMTTTPASTAGVSADLMTGSIQRRPAGMVMPATRAGRYPNPSAAVRASSSKSMPDAGSKGSSAQPSASYQGSTYGHVSSQASTSA